MTAETCDRLGATAHSAGYRCARDSVDNKWSSTATAPCKAVTHQQAKANRYPQNSDTCRDFDQKCPTLSSQKLLPKMLRSAKHDSILVR